MATKESSPFATYMPGLDGLRAAAVLGVIGFHLALYAAPAAEAMSLAVKALRFGWVGVDLFFVLSGFLITGILYDKRSSPNRLRAFYWRRLLRIVPAYYVVLILYATVVRLVGTAGDTAALVESLPWHMTYITNVRVALAGSWEAAPVHTSHFWSLAVEEQFYLLWPAVVGVAVRCSRSPRETLMWFCGTLMIVGAVIRFCLLPQWTYAAYTLLFARMDSLAAGGFFALWARGPKGVEPAISRSLPVLVLGGVALVVLSASSAGLMSYLHPLQQTVGYTLWAVVFGCLVVRTAAGRDGHMGRLLRARPLVVTGRVSYGLYLIHYPVIFVIDHTGLSDLGIIPFSTSVLVVSFALSLLSWKLLESPILRLKRHFSYDAVSSDPVPPSDVDQFGAPLITGHEESTGKRAA